MQKSKEKLMRNAYDEYLILFYTFLCILSAKGVFLTIKKHGIWCEKHFHMHICVNLRFLFLSLYSRRTQNILHLSRRAGVSESRMFHL